MGNALDRFYDGLGNVVLRDLDGKPSVFVRHPKMKSIDFDASLPDHTHPAFIVGNAEDDAVLIGKYLSSTLVDNGPMYSLPNAQPCVATIEDINGNNHKIPSNDAYISTFTIYDFGLLVCTAHLLKVQDWWCGLNLGSDPEDGSCWRGGTTWNAGNIVTFRGWQYKCLKTHTAVKAETYPSDYPALWQKIKKVGGTPALLWTSDTSSITTSQDTYGQTKTNLTGSGPARWYFNGDVWRETDFRGMVIARGIRIKNGAIQIMTQADALDPTVDMTTDAPWKEILPHANDNGYDLVAPGTAGTVHFYISNSTIIYVGRSLESGEFSNNMSNYGIMPQVETASLPYVPCILYELGLMPIEGTVVPFNLRLRARNNTTSYIELFRALSYYVSNDAALSRKNGSIVYMEETTKGNIDNTTSRAKASLCNRLRAREVAAE